MTNDPCNPKQFDCSLCRTHVDMRQRGATAYAIDGDWDKPICAACFQKRHARQRADERKARTDMSVREAFAMAAMQALCSNPSIIAPNSRSGWDYVNCTPEIVAQVALTQADALIAELNK